MMKSVEKLIRSDRPRRARHIRRRVSIAAAAFFALGVVVPAAGASSPRVTPLAIYQVGSSNAVYLLATTGCAKPSCLRLERSTVEVTSFTTVNLPPIGSEAGNPMGTLLSMEFANRSDGYALVGWGGPSTLYVTLNGARTWHRVSIGGAGAPLGFTVTSGAIYAITGVCTKNDDSCHGYAIARSSLAASRWTSSPMPLGHSGKYAWGFPYVPAAYGNDVWISEQPSGPAVIFFSRDGGRTFSKITAPLLGSVNACDLVPKSAADLWAACPTGMQESFFFSKDAGVSWSSVPQDQFFGTGGGSFDAATPTFAFLDYGEAGPLVRLNTTPRSVTTLGKLSCSKTASSIDAMVFSNELDGVALCSPSYQQGSNQLEATTDGGFDWKRVTVTTR